MRDLRDNNLLRRLGYRSEAHVYAGEQDMAHGRHFVSAIDDDGGAVYAVRKSGVPVLVLEWKALDYYDAKGLAWPSVLEASEARCTYRVLGPYEIYAYTLHDIRRHAPALLDQASGVALFNVADANRLLAKYDAKRAARRKGAR